ncbi:MAG: hypothetical protein BJ554DRAFT_2413 [Olpidium bornovanus]|uniref:Uncharacterized protein n=1 Tax=Olpidium bornovanus TaxID=278681 RepID=A0A8H8DGB1_9FUNG|nr:MAG: hypothetical protein BJ554DRAFT_2413 [Olpidium bornovanus]
MTAAGRQAHLVMPGVSSNGGEEVSKSEDSEFADLEDLICSGYKGTAVTNIFFAAACHPSPECPVVTACKACDAEVHSDSNGIYCHRPVDCQAPGRPGALDLRPELEWRYRPFGAFVRLPELRPACGRSGTSGALAECPVREGDSLLAVLLTPSAVRDLFCVHPNAFSLSADPRRRRRYLAIFARLLRALNVSSSKSLRARLRIVAGVPHILSVI